MPRLVPIRLALACALACLFALSTAAATAKGPVVSLRVIGSGGKVLAERNLATATTSLRTSRKATCLGAGTGGSGKLVKVRGNTALGVLARASKSTGALRPLLMTDHFRAEFGLGLCGVGKSRSSSKRSWYLKVNHKDPQRGGEQVKVHAGDEVLWALEPYPYPEELVLSAPVTAKAGQPFTVTVTAYDDAGKHKPAAGVTVTGATAPTGGDGTTTVVLEKPTVLRATRNGDIPSNRVTVCGSEPDMACGALPPASAG
jgi:hypothetical protein